MTTTCTCRLPENIFYQNGDAASCAGASSEFASYEANTYVGHRQTDIHMKKPPAEAKDETQELKRESLGGWEHEVDRVKLEIFETKGYSKLVVSCASKSCKH